MTNALIIVDVQNDFLPSGALPVPHGDEIIQPINELMEHFDWVLASKDWHPKDHISFATSWFKKPGDIQILRGSEQVLWPVHCVENTWGSEFPEALDSDQIHHVFFKGHTKNVDSYSLFLDANQNPATAITTFLTVHQIHKLYFVGLATEYCVKYSVLDALKLGYETFVIEDCCRGLKNETSKAAFKQMKEAKAQLLKSHLLKQEALKKS